MTPGGYRIHEGNLPKWLGSGGLGSTDGLARQGFPFTGLGISDCGSDGLAKQVGLEKHCCLWAIGDGLGGHCCLWVSALCWGGGRFKWIGCTCSLVLWYFLPCASMK